VPARYFLRVTKREKRACRICEKGTITIAPLEPRIIEKGLASNPVVVESRTVMSPDERGGRQGEGRSRRETCTGGKAVDRLDDSPGFARSLQALRAYGVGPFQSRHSSTDASYRLSIVGSGGRLGSWADGREGVSVATVFQEAVSVPSLGNIRTPEAQFWYTQ
jgi:hypothetical protein